MGDLLAFRRADDPALADARRSAGERREGPEPLWREVAGRTLREERHRQGRTLADVAAAAGISVQYLSEVERGLKEPSSEILAAVAGALGLHLADLVAGVGRSLGSVPLHPRGPSGPLALAR